MTYAIDAVAESAAGRERLEHLLAQYDVAKAEADKAAEALKAITDGIKAEATAAAPEGTDDIVITSPDLAASLHLHPVTSERIDTAKLRANGMLESLKAAGYVKPSTSWRLERVRG